MGLSKGKYAQFISDRSGQAFPYKEMVIEWNGSRVHISEFEAKHPQLEPKPTTADSQGLQNARPQIFTQASGDGGFMNVDLTLPGDFAFCNPCDICRAPAGALQISLGSVTVTT